jgi:hypothetical protein
MKGVCVRTAARWMVLLVAGATRLIAAGTPPAHSADLPLVIPHPQTMRMLDGEPLLLGRDGRSVTEVVAAGDGGLFEESEQLIAAALERCGLSSRTDGAVTRIVLETMSLQATLVPGLPRPFPLTSDETNTLARSEQAYVIRSQAASPSTVWIIGASPVGTYYGATTLVQLLTTPQPGLVVLPPVDVCDYPDIPYRMSADWVLQWDWEVNGYDWGDGLPAFLERCKRKIDFCARFKVNRVRFLGGRIAPGLGPQAERYERVKRFALELNRYARRKGVALQYSSSSWGVDYFNWGLSCPQPWVLNRESYPDGPVYACVGGTTGGCFSNEALIDAIVARHRQLVRDTEPSSIYLHQIDAATYHELAEIWKTRCPRCRERFPDDDPASAHGYAAAVAHLYSRIIAGLKSVTNAQSGYDASRDLEIVFASPGYSYATESDADWDKDRKYFAEIGRQLTDRNNVQITFREQYKRCDDRCLRFEEMAASLNEVGWPHAPFVFAVQGGGFIDGWHMFVSSPVLTGINRGAATLYNANGHVHSELQVLANVNYAWNLDAPGSVDPLSLPGKSMQEEAVRYALGQRHSDYLYGSFLESACKTLYGERAAPSLVALFRLERDSGPILAVPAWIDLQWKNAGFDWQAQAERNMQAKQLVDHAVDVCDTQAKEDLIWMSRCLDVAARMCRLCDAVYRQKQPQTTIDAHAAELLTWLQHNFSFEVTEPDGGDPGLWQTVVRRIAAGPDALPGQPPRSETVDGGKTTVQVSSVLPGYRPASVLTSDPSGKDWGQDGGWNDATCGQFPESIVHVDLLTP